MEFREALRVVSTVARVSNAFLTLRMCDECDDWWSPADYKVDIGGGEVTYKCRVHLVEAAERMVHS